MSDAQKERPSRTAETGSRGVAADEPDALGVATDESDAQSSVDDTSGPVRPALVASPCEVNGLGEELDVKMSLLLLNSTVVPYLFRLILSLLDQR